MCHTNTTDSNASYYSWPRITVDQDLGDLQGGMRSTQNQLEENKVQLWRNHQEESHQKCSRPTFSPSVKEEVWLFHRNMRNYTRLALNCIITSVLSSRICFCHQASSPKSILQPDKPLQ